MFLIHKKFNQNKPHFPISGSFCGNSIFLRVLWELKPTQCYFVFKNDLLTQNVLKLTVLQRAVLWIAMKGTYCFANSERFLVP